VGAKLVKFEVKSFSEVRVIGKSVIQKLDAGMDDSTITDLWKSMDNDGSLAFLSGLPKRLTQNPDTVGWMGDFKPGDGEFTYLAGILAKPNTPVPSGYVYRDIPNCTMAIGWIQETADDKGGDIHANASEHMAKAKKENGYEFDGSHGFFEMEYYSFERFRISEKRGEKVILDFYSPCKKVIK
jgi:predicted transcriptional regulator YdeE